MKKIFSILLCTMLLINCSTFVFADETQGIDIFLDGYPVNFDVAPIIQNNRVLVPFRAIAEALNIQVDWNDTSKTVTAKSEDKNVILQIGSSQAYVNSETIPLDVPPQIIGERTLIPLRFFSEAFNCEVEWDSLTGSVKVISPIKSMSIMAYYALGDSNTSSWTDLFANTYPNHGVGNTDYISSLELGWYSLDKTGTLLTKSRTGWQRPEGWETVIETASLYDVSSEMVVHVTDGDNTLTDLLASDTAIDTAAKAIAAEANLYQGVNLDFEGLGLSQTGDALITVQQSFTKFVKALRDNLDESKTLTLALHPLNSSYKGYDYKALGEISDSIIIMAYDYGTKPENDYLVAQAITQSLALVPKEKLVLGISVPNETSDTIKTKIGLAKRYDLNGIALWRLGLIDDNTWQSLKLSISAE